MLTRLALKSHPANALRRVVRPGGLHNARCSCGCGDAAIQVRAGLRAAQLCHGSSVVLPAALRASPRLEYKRRTRSTGTSDYAVFDLRVSRQFGLYEIRLEGSNLGDATYQEFLVSRCRSRRDFSLAYRP